MAVPPDVSFRYETLFVIKHSILWVKKIGELLTQMADVQNIFTE
jgi:hypothetical protein